MPQKDRKLIAFNWKENPATEREAVRLFRGVLRHAAAAPKDRRVIVFPPFLYLAELARLDRSSHMVLELGAQDIFWENGGAYTGGIGPTMVRDIGKAVRWTIVGHSERRRFFGETDDMVNKKLMAARDAGLRVVLCVGESDDIHRKGPAATRRYVKDQLMRDLRGSNFRSRAPGGVVVAYEPIWAIGTGKHCPPEEARAMARFIKDETSGVPVLYGGSVDGVAAVNYLFYTEINGVLVGGAGLQASEAGKIIKNK
jgi:triosephosphate isomerase